MALRGLSIGSLTLVNVVIEGCNKYDVVKAVACKLLRILKNLVLFWSFEN